MAVKKSLKQTLGRVDRIDFPDFGLENVPCKIDTGAATSSIHVERVRVLEKEDGELLSVRIKDPGKKGDKGRTLRFTEFRERKIRSSNGISEIRFVIKTKMIILGDTFETEITLADREKMQYPVLVGNKALSGRFVVDVAKINQSYKQKQKQAKES